MLFNKLLTKTLCDDLTTLLSQESRNGCLSDIYTTLYIDLLAVSIPVPTNEYIEHIIYISSSGDVFDFLQTGTYNIVTLMGLCIQLFFFSPYLFGMKAAHFYTGGP